MGLSLIGRRLESQFFLSSEPSGPTATLKFDKKTSANNMKICFDVIGLKNKDKENDTSYTLYFIKITKMHWAKQGGGKKADQGIIQSVHCCFRLCSLYIFRQSPFFSWRCSCTLITVTPSPVTHFFRFVHLPSYSHCCVYNL